MWDSPLLWLKVGYTAFLALLVPFYVVVHGVKNFLWFSDIALLATGLALWTESALLASAMSVGVLAPELLWIVSFFGRLLARVHVTSIADYMFDPNRSRFMRGLSLALHFIMPATLVYLLASWGYEPWGLVLQVAVAFVVLPVTYLVTDPDKNINWVFGFGHPPRRRMPSKVHLLALMLGYPIVVYLPTHFALLWLF